MQADENKRKPYANTKKAMLEIYELLKTASSKRKPLSIMEIVRALEARGPDVAAGRDTVKKLLEELQEFYPKEICCDNVERRGGSGYTFHYHYEPASGEGLLENNVKLVKQIVAGNRGGQLTETVLDYRFNGYGSDKKLHPVGDYYDVLPVQVCELGGRYYMVAQMPGKAALFHFRLDLMTDLKLKKRKKVMDDSQKFAANRAADARDYQSSHPYMFFERGTEPPKRVTLRVTKWEGRPDASLTLLHDVFGDGWEVLHETDTEAEVQVRCPPAAVEPFVRQHIDRVKVIGPEDIRQSVENDLRDKLERYLGAGC